MAGRQLAAAIIGEWKSTSRRRVELDFQWDLAIAIVDSSDQKKNWPGPSMASPASLPTARDHRCSL